MRAAVALTAAAVALLGCTRADRSAVVTVTAVPTAAADACRRFADKLPDDLGEGLRRRTTSPGGPHVAAYGDPPVVVRCGAPRSAAYHQGDPLISLNGVEWFAEERAGEVVWSLPRSFVNVEVTVPSAYTGDRLARLAPAVNAAQRR